MNNSDSMTGQFLIAMPNLAESFFDHALIYMLEHNEEGALGLIINQPLDISVDDILMQIKEGYDEQFHPEHVMCGGPVEMHRGFVLHRPRDDAPWESQVNLCSEIAVTTSTDILAAMANGQDIGDSLLVLGYSGWAPQQLEQELADNAWLTVKAKPDVMFNTPSKDRLDKVIHSLGISYEQLCNDSGHA